uniref:Archease domain-containing protein n=1 Tax=Strigamia maritima TaxID=126957 RepID=T1JD31_STRMM
MAASIEETLPAAKYEYLDHTADVHIIGVQQLVKKFIHVSLLLNFITMKILIYHPVIFLNSFSGGDSLTEAFEQAAVAMFGYMTEIDSVDMLTTETIEVEGMYYELFPRINIFLKLFAFCHDMISLLYNYLDEFLFVFSADPFFIARKVQILEFDKEKFRIRAKGFGETFDLDKHPQGTEVKAITYSNMQVHDKEGMHELY